MEFNPPASIYNVNNEYDEQLQQHFNQQQRDSNHSSMPPMLNQQGLQASIRNKDDVYKAAHDIKGEWLIDCKENKPGYLDNASDCLERFIDEMETVSARIPVAVNSLEGLEIYGWKERWKWLSWAMHNKLWPTIPNPIPSPFAKDKNKQIQLSQTTSINSTQTTSVKPSPIHSTSTSVTTTPNKRQSNINGFIPPRSIICLDKEFRGSACDLVKGMFLIINNGLKWNSELKKGKQGAMGGIEAVLKTFCSTSCNMTSIIPQVNKYYYKHHLQIPSNQRPNVIEKVGTNNRNAAYRFMNEDVYNFFKSKFSIDKNITQSLSKNRSNALDCVKKSNSNNKRSYSNMNFDKSINNDDYSDFGKSYDNDNQNTYQPAVKKYKISNNIYNESTNNKENTKPMSIAEILPILKNFKEQADTLRDGLVAMITQLEEQDQF